MVLPVMEFDRGKQCLLLEGKVYKPEDIIQQINEREGTAQAEQAGSAGDTSSAINELFLFLRAWFDSSPCIKVHTSGSTGAPKELTVRKDQMMQSARLTCEFLHLQPGDTALLCMNLRHIGAMMVVVRALVAKLNLIIRPASGHPLATFLPTQKLPKFAAMVPLQVYNTLLIPQEKKLLTQIDILIIGGGAIDKTLETAIQALSGTVYSTYGMTETLSHIALRRLSGKSASKRYIPFAGIRLSLSPENSLIIEAPLICDTPIHTNDIAHIYDDGSFIILGRKDNVINSGGIKIQAEALEKTLHPYIPIPFVITSTPDERLGEALTLLLETDDISKAQEIENKIIQVLPPYHRPQHIETVKQIPQTDNGKIDRKSCREKAREIKEEKA